ncbi:flagellar motor stator protein MotA [Syntrophorhabdus aromaticivorans]|uniref:Flagellar motor stator protein MotA n=1 Tax=Syntrophorhabdus aromaticivorans TaxID=328301 RepID=A0A351U433_9BACT|nr:flagellar motor stator protein MotA [Syntrophorhabdus aromaticivorans]NLW34354.1 flagellar motor stator protein MotA [Syntrophorhabdus aromaticivorans]HBA54714.1 flagellar motor stator protein MotA [Syntrophorhabdus aromaticivorans]
MFIIIGGTVVLLAVLGGFALEGGSFLILMQVAEFIIIGGSAAGALLIMTPAAVLKKIIRRVLGALKGNKISKATYLSLLKLMFEVFQLTRRDGLIALESHVESPDKSSIFSKYPDLLQQGHVMLFMCDTLRLIVMGGIMAHDIEGVMDIDIESHHHDGAKPGMILQKIGDSMPGLGIVAAVLGIVITMQAINGPPEEIGHKVAAALVGTFLGIFLSYGFIQPLATNLDLAAEEEANMLEAIKAGIVCLAKGFNPIVSIEFARRAIANDHRPSFQEMEAFVKEFKKVN